MSTPTGAELEQGEPLSSPSGIQTEAFSHHPVQATEANVDQDNYYTVTHEQGARARRFMRQREQSPEEKASRKYAGGEYTSEISPHEGVSSSTSAFGKEASVSMQAEGINGQYNKPSSSLPPSQQSEMVSGSVSSQDFELAKKQVEEILRDDCHPIAITILVANDNMSAPLRRGVGSTRAADSTQSVITDADIAGHPGVNHDFKPAQPPPEFNAVDSCEMLQPELESSGVMVIPIVNKTKSYLIAVLKVLAQTPLPRSCELLWFIFTGHGQRSNICLNGELMEFNQLINLASKITTRYFTFFFECCQVNGDLIKASNFQQEHMTIYSSPPNEVSYYYDGVGLMVICLADMLKGGYGESLNKLQQELRSRMIDKMQEVLIIPMENAKAFLGHHLPVHTSTMFSDINLNKKAHDAMSPKISAQKCDDNFSASITVYTPKKLLHHPSYNLEKYIVVAKPVDGKEVQVTTSEARFGGVSKEVVVTLPPWMSAGDGEVRVGAEYGNGFVAYSMPVTVEDWPQYGKPTMSFTSEHGGYAVSVAFNPNITLPSHEYYNVEYIEIGFSVLGRWIMLNHMEGHKYTRRCLVTLPPSLSSVMRYLQVAVKYKNCPSPILSDTCPVEQPAIAKPKILEVKKIDCLTTGVKFSPLAPSLPTGTADGDQYKVNSFYIQSRFKDGEWVEVYRKPLQGNEDLEVEEEILVRSHLCSEIRRCEYQVVLCYDSQTIGELKSDVETVYIGALECPHNVDVMKHGGSNRRVNWSHSLPKESQFHNDIEYTVVEVDSGSHEETVLNGRRRSVRAKNMVVEGRHEHRLKVGVHFKDCQGLGCVYSEPYQGSKVHYHVCSLWRSISCAFKIFLTLFLIFITLPPALIPYVSRIRVNETQLIVANQTISYHQDGNSLLCGGINATELIVEYSDNSKGLNVSVFLVDRGEVKTENVVVPNDVYDGVNRTIESGSGEKEVRYLVPSNYYSFPVYLLEGSTIVLECQIHGLKDGDSLFYALVHIFDSHDSAANYQLGKGSLERKTHTINVTQCVSSVCIFNYTVTKKSFYFPVLASKADFDFTITTNFSFYAIQYVDPFIHFNSSDIAVITKNSSQFIGFEKSKLILLYVHWPAHFYETKISHLNFRCSPASFVLGPIIAGSIIPLVLLLSIAVIYFTAIRFRRRRLVIGRTGDSVNERTPLIQKP